MDIFNIKKQWYANIFSKMLIFFSIITTASSLVVITRFSSQEYFALSFILFIGLFIFYILTRRRAKMNIKVLIYTLLLSMLVLISQILNLEFDLLNFAIISMFFTAAFIFTIVSPAEFINVYIKTMFGLSVYSLIMTYLVPMLAPSIIYYFPIGYNSGGFAVRDYILSFQYVGLVSRNTGIFREMGVYSVYLNFALFFILFTKNNFKNRMLGIIIIVITILSTLSTPGLIGMVLLMGAYLLNLKHHNKQEIKRIIIIFLILAFIIIIIFPISLSYLNDSFNKLTQRGSSYVGRMDSILTNIEVWKSNPIFGVGYTESIRKAEAISAIKGVFHNTSTTTSFLAMYGLFFTMLLSLPIAIFVKSLKINKVSKVLIIMGLFLILNAQRLFLDSLMYFITYCFLLVLVDGKNNGGVIK